MNIEKNKLPESFYTINVIATFRNTDQEFFDQTLTEKQLENEVTMIVAICKSLNNRLFHLVKLSLCFNEADVKRNSTIEKSIKLNNGKYYF